MAEVIDNNSATTTNTAESKNQSDNKPSDSPLKQQKLRAWQPILTAGTVLPVFYIIGFVFIPIGSALLVASNSVYEYSFDYTDCEKFPQAANLYCKNDISFNCVCKHTFNVAQPVEGPVFIYYGLSNFYQNHRRYVKSRDDSQLLGNMNPSVVDDCSPFDRSGDYPIVPCGAIANSMFNDTFYLRKLRSATNNLFVVNHTVEFNFKGIAWYSDIKSKFRNPADYPKNIENLKRNTSKPKNWNISIFDLPGAFQNESFIVWMRISALPTFRKLYAVVKNLEAGNYTMEILYNYPVDIFDARKRFILSTTSWAGGKNHFLGVAYIIVGCLCVFSGTVFLFIHLKYGKTLTEMANVHR